MEVCQMAQDALGFYKPDKAYNTVMWELKLASEIDFTTTIESFDTEEDAEQARQDNLELIDIKMAQLSKAHDMISTQLIRKLVD